MHTFRTLRSVVAVVGGAALAITLTALPAQAHHSSPAPATVAVQTYNMDFGGDLSHLFDPSLDLVTATSTVWAETVSSDIPTRARGVARSIARLQPDLVGLQEVSTWRTAPTLDGRTPSGAFVTDYDSLSSLLAALARLGTPYRAVAVDTTFTNEAFPLPAMTSSGLRLVAFTDYNVILVRQRSLGQLRLSSIQTGTYVARLPVTVAGIDIQVTRGWAQTDVTLHGRSFRFVDTHLEAFGAPGTLKDQVRNPQAQELAYRIAQSPIPVVLVGDINARPDMCTDIPRTDPAEHALDQNVVAYTTLRESGLTEAWYAVHRDDPCAPRSWTSGSRILDDPTNLLTHRIDDVFTSSGARTLAVRVTGNRPWSMTGGLWPSDHASTWALVSIR